MDYQVSQLKEAKRQIESTVHKLKTNSKNI